MQLDFSADQCKTLVRQRQHFSLVIAKSYTRQSGFSLLELVVVVAVLAILAAIAIPAFQDVANNAKIATAKANITTTLKECLLLLSSGNANPTIADVASARTSNPYGDALGLGFGSDDGFTYDTDLDSRITLRPTHSCLSLAAKSATFANSGGPADGKLPHFSIYYDSSSGVIKKDCKVDGASTYNKNQACNPSRPAGSQW